MNAALPPGDMAVIFGSGLAVVPDGAEVIDPGPFQLWIGGSSEATLSAPFTVTPR